MGRDCDGGINFLSRDCRIVDMRKEGGIINVAILSVTYNVKLVIKELKVSTHTSLTHSIPTNSGCANASKNLFGIDNHVAFGSLLMKQDFAHSSVFVAIL